MAGAGDKAMKYFISFLALCLFVNVNGVDIYPSIQDRIERLAKEKGDVTVAIPNRGDVKAVGQYIYLKEHNSDHWFHWGRGHGVATSLIFLMYFMFTFD